MVQIDSAWFFVFVTAILLWVLVGVTYVAGKKARLKRFVEAESSNRIAIWRVTLLVAIAATLAIIVSSFALKKLDESSVGPGASFAVTWLKCLLIAVVVAWMTSGSSTLLLRRFFLTWAAFSLVLFLSAVWSIPAEQCADAERMRRVAAILHEERVPAPNTDIRCTTLVPFAGAVSRPLGKDSVFYNEQALARLADRELAAVLAHELGHAIHGDTLRSLLYFQMFAFSLLAISYVTAKLADRLVDSTPIRTAESVKRAIFFATSAAFSYSAWIYNVFDGRLAERRADAFAVKYNFAQPLVSAHDKFRVFEPTFESYLLHGSDDERRSRILSGRHPQDRQ
jgi:Zn-dependent protease with chaperone function